MRTNRCRQLRALLTSYVDSEASAGERLIVEDHLRQCHACRRRVDREGAVRRRLQGWSAETRAQGAALSWSGPSETRHYLSLGALIGASALLAATVVVGLATWNRRWVDTDVPIAARGQISDSRCASGHAHEGAEFRNMSGRDCVHRCIEMGAQYVFISRGVVYPIRNQDFGDLARFAGQDVELEGEVRRKLLTVLHLRPPTVSRSNTDLVTRKVRMS